MRARRVPQPGREGTRQRPVRSWAWSAGAQSSARATPGQGQVAVRVRSDPRARDFRTGASPHREPLLPPTARPTRAQAPLFPGKIPACGGSRAGHRVRPPSSATTTPGLPQIPRAPYTQKKKCPRPALSASPPPSPLFPFPHLGFVTSLDPLPLALPGCRSNRPRVAMVMQGRADTRRGGVPGLRGARTPRLQQRE